MNAADAKAVAALLSKWALEEMNFKCVAVADVRKVASDLVPLCKGGTITNLWHEVMGHVKTKKRATLMKENVQLQTLIATAEEGRRELEEQRREIEMLEKDVESLGLHLSRSKQDLQSTNLNLLKIQEEERKIQIKTTLYKHYSSHLMTKDFGFKSFLKWFQELCSVYCKNLELGKKADSLEVSFSEIAAVCLLLQEKLDEQKDDAHSGEEMNSVWAEIGRVIVNHPPDSITESVQRLTEDAIEKMKKEGEGVDLEENLKVLETKYLGGENNGSPLDTVQNMLRQWDLDCVKSFTRFLTSRKNTEKWTRESETLKREIIERYRSSYEGDSSCFQLAVDNLEAETELASCRGCLQSFESSVARLEDDINRKSNAQTKLMQLKEEIKNFSHTLAVNQQKIISLTKHNSNVKSNLTKRQMEVLSGAKKSVCERQPLIAKSCRDLQGAMHDWTIAFSQADIAKLRALNLGDDRTVLLKDLGIRRFSDTSHNMGGAMYQKALSSLDLHSHLAPSSVMRRVFEIKRDISEYENLETVKIRSSFDACDELKRLEKETLTLEKDQMNKLGLKYKKGFVIVKSAVDQSKALSDLTKVWYDQPAQNQTPWLKVDGCTLSEWKKKFDIS